MIRVRSLFPAEHSEPVECNQCGEGQMSFALVRAHGASPSRFAFHCEACEFTLEEY